MSDYVARDDARGIHLGLGRLGLGLVVPIMADCFPVVLADRERLDPVEELRGESLAKRRALDAIHAEARFAIVEQLNGNRTDCTVGACVRIPAGDGYHEIQEIVDSAEPIVLTTALTIEGLEAQVPKIRAIVATRELLGCETLIIPCENRVGAKFREFADEVRDSQLTVVARTVVDRVCYELTLEGGRATVKVHPFASWVIERTGMPLDRLLEQIAARSEFVHLVDDYEPHYAAKLWLLNGPHAALALAAHAVNVPRIDIALHEPEIEEEFRALQGVLSAAVSAQFAEEVDAQEIRDTCERNFVAFANSDDDVDRVLSRFRRRRLVEFFDDLDEKLGVPARIVAALGGDISPLHKVVRRIEILIQLGRYLDAVPTTDPVAGEEDLESLDAAAVEAFRRLAEGWNTPEEIDRTVASIEHSLTLDRSVRT